jgi:signal transduction histidine kinase
MTTRRRWAWYLAVALLLLLAARTVLTEHREFRRSLEETFIGQQSMFTSALANVVRDFVAARERDLDHVIHELLQAGPGLAGLDADRLAALHARHLEGFDSVSVHLPDGELVAISPARDAAEETRLGWIRATIASNRDRASTFVSNSYLSRDYKTTVFLFVPFAVPGRGTCFIVGGLQVEDYLVAHLPAWKGRSMAVVLADDDGDILSLLTASHQRDPRMKLGNLHDLDEPCLRCHSADEFRDMGRALRSGAVEHSLFTPPGSVIAFNRATLAFPVRNQRWVISLISPYEGVEAAVDRQAGAQLVLALFALVALCGLGYAVHRVVELGHVAAANEALRRSEEELRLFARRLEEANRMKDLFTDIVRHDLMSPLSAAIGYAELLGGAEPGAGSAQMLPGLRRTLGKAREIIESTATLSRLEEIGTLELHEGDLAEVIDGVLGQQALALRAAGIAVSLELAGRYPVMMNAPLLEQVFVNLVSNAVKYAARGGRIEVGVGERGSQWVARVKDWGEGIPDAAKPRVFDRLERFHKEGVKGSGLGLAIVRRVVTLHRGEVWVGDNPEGGCVFYVALPKAGVGG